MKNQLFLFALYILSISSNAQSTIYTTIEIDSNKTQSFTIDSVNVYIKDKNNDKWTSLLENNDKTTFAKSSYTIRLIEYVNTKKDSIDFDLTISNDKSVELGIKISLATTTTMSIVNNKFVHTSDTIYQTSITTLHYTPLPDKLKIRPISKSNSEFIIKNKTSNCIYGIGDSVSFYGILLKKEQNIWKGNKLNIEYIDESFCIRTGKSHKARININDTNDLPSGEYFYQLELSNNPIDFAFKKLSKESDELNKVIINSPKTNPVEEDKNGNKIRFSWKIRELSLLQYTYGFKVPEKNK